MKLITVLSEPLQENKIIIPVKENEIIIPVKYEPKLLVRDSYYKRYELQKLILLLVSNN